MFSHGTGVVLRGRIIIATGAPVLQVMVFSHSVKSDSLRPHGLQHSRPLCPPLAG